MKHTPGPLTATARHVRAPETDERLPLDVQINGGNREDNRANLRLISAAPELLESLIEILDACDRCGKDDDKSLVDEFTQEIEDKARAAVFKALGRKP